MKNFIAQLPEACQDIAIKPRHKVALEHRKVGNEMWVVLLTLMPGDCCKAWRAPIGEYWKLEPKHGSRDRFIRANWLPCLKGACNPKQLQLF